MISTPRLFADDTAVLIHANTLTELEIKINRELENVVVWTRKNNLTINPIKSQPMIYYRLRYLNQILPLPLN